MHVILVAGGTPSWMNSGWGQALKDGEAKRLLVSFVEYSKDGRASMAVTGMDAKYEPKAAEPKP